MRCFVALDLPRPVKNHLHKVTAPLRERFDLKWVAPDQMHVTLVFAGDVEERAARELGHAVQEVALPPLSLSLASFGVFPPKGLPRVIWAGLGGDVEALRALHEELAARAEQIGVPREKRPFSPHVTVARLKSAFSALALLDRVHELSAELKKKPFAPTGLTLYRSTLTPGGPRHEALVTRDPVTRDRG
ncbi:MAG TPA: RNA 2',3'-cyclic phosphodiesterase [bacterium]|nr:RNA 2',3'-cyclic phosphodiesterase [bacterium]